MVGAVVGLLTLLSALVLGLLIWTAYGVYSGQNVAIQTLAAKDLQLDLALMDYGSEAVAGRALFRQGIARTVDDIWDERQHAESKCGADDPMAATQSPSLRMFNTAVMKKI